MSEAPSSINAPKLLPVIDFHAHVIDPEVYAKSVNHNAITDFGAHPEGPRPEPGTLRARYYECYSSPEAQLKDMDALGIDIRLISSTGVSQSSWWAEPRLAADLDRHANQWIAQWVKAHPTRFIGSFTLPLQDLGLAVKELEYAVCSLGLRVANLPAEVNGAYLGDPRFGPLWTAIQQHGVTVWVHPDGMKDKSFEQYALWNGIGQPIQETMLISSLMYEGVLDAFPEINFAISHGGGYLPQYMARLDRNYVAHPKSRKNLTRRPSEYLKCFYYDTCVYASSVLEDLIRHVGVERIVLGSDYPVGDKDPFEVIRGCTNLSSVDFDLITRTTPGTILGLDQTIDTKA
jgi:aminocarboxymuconate-semialdehyde decarboxylase